MDFWVVAAAAGAGYLAKYWQRLTKEGEGFPESFLGDSVGGKSDTRSLLEHLRNKTSPFCVLDQRRLGEDVSSSKEEASSDGRFSGTSRLSIPDAEAGEMVSTSVFDDEVTVDYGRYEDYNLLSLSSWPTGFSPKRNNLDNVDRIKGNSEVGDKSGDGLPELSRGEMGSCYGSGRSINSLRSRWPHGYSVKPLSSLESCLIAQMYKEHVGMEEYVFSSLPSPSTPTVRPLLVTDGSRIISKTSSESYNLQFESGGTKLHKENDFCSVEKNTVLGVPPLPEFGPVELPNNPKQKRGTGRLGRLSRSNTKVYGKQFQSQGSPDGMFLFCLGITFGVISTVIKNKKEVDKLNELLKQTENLVQDLQEELEMKDSLTVKELANEGYESQETYNHSSHYDVKGSEDLQKSEENADSLSKIEAELEAELERLELNMNASSLERRLSGLVELSPDFVADIAHGELRADKVNGGVGGQDDSDKDASGTSTDQTQNANYAVSPRELSLRLHEVIRSRLEERIMELETALQNSQKRVHLMESKGMNLQRGFSNRKMESPFQDSQAMIEEDNTITQPLFLNLSGDALDAYSEAYEELMKVTETDDEESSFTTYKSNQIDKEELPPLDQIFVWDQNGGEENGSPPHMKIIEERDARSLVRDNVRKWDERMSRSRGSNEVGESEDDTEDGDEMAKLLIKQILEKTRQGSPVVLNAQKMLFSMD